MDRPKNASGTPTRPVFTRVCDSCREYSAHIDHEGLLYDHFTEGESGTGTYHRHVVYCPDLALPKDAYAAT